MEPSGNLLTATNFIPFADGKPQLVGINSQAANPPHHHSKTKPMPMMHISSFVPSP